ncbi:uncharacterized protein MELLADRAFT_100998 [Melampsora larici-populina 98AG31]|uniref:Glucose-methanol-choline oxidoreductase N-terminal domain-containing protein n=1 Tax=Melampsora larici-populina (strain 98AG31 / pathotype 3-4-7) TaxID=747676 RepID=F4R396_MELLP|nr:uncharacterized protein MELLADRAFT_100998 [Melampsora larici-populina 98AG31]EGG12590.1 hypothetical protein MELLADRAFT_100998 [Melampsora larici-populina 98AG31]
MGNIGISIPGLAGTLCSTFRTQVDWNYSTIALKQAENRSIIYPRGKVLGGSSAINFMLTTKASRHDYNTFEKLGNPGWGWDEFDRAAKKSENLLIPPPSANFSFSTEYHGKNGPVKTSFSKFLPPIVAKYFPAIKKLGHVRTFTDNFKGDVKGPAYVPLTIDDNLERVTSASAYYFPIASRPNLVVRVKSEVDRLLVSSSKTEEVTVGGVEYISEGLIRTTFARKEVILSAGSIGSPAILERSGMGDSSVLKKFNIPVLLNLPGVGANLIDHPMNLNVHQLKPGFFSSDKLARNATYAAEQLDLYNTRREGILTQVVSLLDFEPLRVVLTEEEISEGLQYLEHNSTSLPPQIFEAIKEQVLSGTPFEFLVINQGSAQLEGTSAFSASQNVSYIAIASSLQYPFSRGSSHISSRDPTEPPLIDTGFLNHPFGLWLFAKACKHSRKIMQGKEWDDVILGEISPGNTVHTDEDWRRFAAKNIDTFYHPVGTAAMLPRELGGVVDPDLRVYGTHNLRVIDASIFPVHIATHPQLSIYAIAEIAAEKILESRA